MKHIIIYLAIALVMFGLLGWYFAQQEDLQPKALQAELSVSNVAKLPQQKVEMLFSDMSNEEKNSFRIAIQNELGAAMDVAAHDCMGSAEVQMTYAKKVLEQGCTVLMLETGEKGDRTLVIDRYSNDHDLKTGVCGMASGVMEWTSSMEKDPARVKEPPGPVACGGPRAGRPCWSRFSSA